MDEKARLSSPSPSEPYGAGKTGKEEIPIDEVAERKLVRKLDLMIIPPVMRNARLYHLESDLGLSGNQYQLSISLLFITYILSELPSNLVLKKFRPSRWLSFITLAWGIIATLTGVVQNFAGLVVCRLLLGLVEGGLFPGLTIYLTLFYTKREIALRVGYLFVSAAVAGSLGGLLAYAIGFMDGIAGQSGWRWILIIEGLPCVVLGIACWWWLADDPETAYYLNAEEKLLVRTRKKRQTGWSKGSDEFHKSDVIKALKDWKIWIFSFAQFGADTMLYGYSTFLPTIIKGLDPSWSAATVQALTIPCYALGAITYLSVAWVSDRTQQRGILATAGGLVSIVGYAILIAKTTSGVHYFGCFLVAMGLYVNVGLPFGWVPCNNPRYGKRTTAIGLQLTIGNCSGIMAPFLYPTKDAPRYVKGHSVTLAMVAFASAVYAFMSIYFRQRNARRQQGMEDWKTEGMSEEEIKEMGDESPGYMFTY